ncbi:helix-turn-helix domain-containing protein [Solemya velesiana gill symbiont]|uniref:helix-turn-helix domain-containing protein n=1 Tax=Solemya velesiana gill symbiont TaxID=1918948 RepID=UPI001560F391
MLDDENHKQPPRDLSVTEVCAITDSTPPTVYKLINSGVLVSYKVGRSRRITGESVEALRSGKSDKACA